MTKWEYLEVSDRFNILCSQAKINNVANQLQIAFPGAKINVKNGRIIETDIWDRDLIDFLGGEGWELVAMSEHDRLIFKRPIG